MLRQRKKIKKKTDTSTSCHVSEGSGCKCSDWSIQEMSKCILQVCKNHRAPQVPVSSSFRWSFQSASLVSRGSPRLWFHQCFFYKCLYLCCILFPCKNPPRNKISSFHMHHPDDLLYVFLLLQGYQEKNKFIAAQGEALHWTNDKLWLKTLEDLIVLIAVSVLIFQGQRRKL